MSKSKRIDAMVADYGNTLVLDPFLRILRTRSGEFQKLLDVEGYGVSWQRIAQLWTKKNCEINYPFISHFYQEEAIVKLVLRDAGVMADKDVGKTSSNLLEEYRRGFREILARDKRRIEVAQTLDFLRNKHVKLAVASNEKQSALELGLTYYGIRDFFDSVLSSETIGVEKPDVRFFSYVLETVGSRPETTIYVGDDPARDIVPAKKIGMTTVLYIPPRKYPGTASWRNCDYSRSNPDYIIRKFSELKQLV
jgi:HAD superfamily hydrolase (TIGR01549 family)